jgi:uncharacterized protein YegL
MGIENRDYTLILDRSGSMSTGDCNGKTRWQAARESTEAIASKISTVDQDGITLYTFSGSHKRYDNVTPDKVTQVFKETDPMGTTNLAAVLKDAFNDWEKRKKAGSLKEGDTILVVTDGEPDDKKAVADTIKAITQKMDADSELSVAFFQIGRDTGARDYLRSLDDGLTGAKFDIVDAKSFDELENMSLTEALIAAIED